MSPIKQTALFLFACIALFAIGCKSPTLTVMTFNIRYDTPSDGPNAWPKRRPLVADMIKKHDPDVLGLQEVLVSQRDDLLADLSSYGCVGVGRDDGANKGEFAPILFKRGRFALVDKGWFWLSESPDTPGRKGWDAACPRIATWVRLRDSITKGEFMVLNTHFDHRGEQARLESAKLIATFLKKHADTSQIVTGDFNCGSDQPPHRILLEASGDFQLHDAFADLPHDDPDAGTFNGFEGVRTGPRIDWILHTRGFMPLSCEIDRDSRNERYPSDHFPVTARLRIALPS